MRIGAALFLIAAAALLVGCGGSDDDTKAVTISDFLYEPADLEEAGSFDYYCAFHPFMKGTLEVG